MTITEFILARVAEDEAVAHAAIDPARPGTHWHWEDPTARWPRPAVLDGQYEKLWLATVEEFPTRSVGPLPSVVIDTTEVDTPHGAGAFRHIARWDPARVLAECKAKRAIVTEHRPANLEADGTVVDFSSPEEADFCFGCGANFVEEWSTKLEECPTLRALAAIYAAHPDYDESWTL